MKQTISHERTTRTAVQQRIPADAAARPKIVGILVGDLVPTLVPIYRCGAAECWPLGGTYHHAIPHQPTNMTIVLQWSRSERLYSPSEGMMIKPWDTLDVVERHPDIVSGA